MCYTNLRTLHRFYKFFAADMCSNNEKIKWHSFWKLLFRLYIEQSTIYSTNCVNIDETIRNFTWKHLFCTHVELNTTVVYEQLNPYWTYAFGRNSLKLTLNFGFFLYWSWSLMQSNIRTSQRYCRFRLQKLQLSTECSFSNTENQTL